MIPCYDLVVWLLATTLTFSTLRPPRPASQV
jgi:hypothetical protein